MRQGVVQLKIKPKYHNHTVITLQSTEQEMSYLENCGEILNFWPVWRRKPNDNRLFRGMTFIIFANSIYMRIKSRYCVTLTYLIWRQRRINHISHNATLPTILSSWRDQVISSFRMDEPRRACRWPPMFSNRRCHTYIPGQRVHFWGQIVWLVFPSAEMFVWTWTWTWTWFVSLPRSLSERRNDVAQTPYRDFFDSKWRLKFRIFQE